MSIFSKIVELEKVEYSNREFCIKLSDLGVKKIQFVPGNNSLDTVEVSFSSGSVVKIYDINQITLKPDPDIRPIHV